MTTAAQPWLVIVNPRSRNGRGRQLADASAQTLRARGIRFALVETKSSKHARVVAADSRKNGYSRVIAIGGDGTAHHVANGAIAARLPFGLIPAGSGNDFGRAIGLNDDPEFAVDTLVRGNKQSINVLKVTTRDGVHYSINMTDAGIGARVALAAQTQLKWLFGPLRYNLISMGTVLSHRNVPSVVTIDDGAPRHVNLTMVICGHGQTAGAGMHFLPAARFIDDRMHGCLVHNAGRVQIIKALRRVRKARHAELTDIVEHFTASRVSVETVNESEPCWVESEGEVRGRTRLVMEVLHRGLEVYVAPDFNLSQPSTMVTEIRRT